VGEVGVRNDRLEEADKIEGRAREEGGREGEREDGREGTYGLGDSTTSVGLPIHIHGTRGCMHCWPRPCTFPPPSCPEDSVNSSREKEGGEEGAVVGG